MLISNTDVTFKYECYLFLQQTAPHTHSEFLYDQISIAVHLCGCYPLLNL